MKTPKPNFYLTSSEWTVLNEPRKCWVQKTLSYGDRDDLLLIELAPPIVYHDSREGSLEMVHAVIAARHEGVTLLSISDWPVYVHLARLKRDLSPDTYRLEKGDLENVAWCELYPSASGARKGTPKSPS